MKRDLMAKLLRMLEKIWRDERVYDQEFWRYFGDRKSKSEGR
jgi:hypothetical protein